MSDVIVAVHQPNFFPWLGYFHKICQADIFVVLDHTKNQVKNAGWLKRVNFFNQKEVLVTIPLRKGAATEIPIYEMQIETVDKNYLKAHEIIKTIYRKHPFYPTVYPLVADFFENSESEFICDRNLKFITSVLERIDSDIDIRKSSGMNLVESSSRLMAEITHKVGGTVYLSGTGAMDYNRLEDFEGLGIELRYNSFDLNGEHFKYRQQGMASFVGGLSTIDLLMNEGFDGLKQKLLDTRLAN